MKHMNSAGVLAALRNYDYYASRIPNTVKQSLVPWSSKASSLGLAGWENKLGEESEMVTEPEILF